MNRIIFTVTNDLNYDQRMIRICTSLSGKGYDVLLVGREKKGSAPLVARPFRQRRMRLLFEKGKLFYLEYNFRLLFFLLVSNFQAVCAIDLDTLLPAWLVTRLRRKSLIFDAHEYFTEVPEVVDRKWVKRAWEAVARLCIPSADRAYTVCESLAEIFEKKYKKHFRVIRNVPQKKELSQVPVVFKSPFILLYQGVLNEGRGLEEMIEAMKGLEHCELWLAGEGDLSERLRVQVRTAGLEARVRFLGYVLPDDLVKITQSAFIGLNLLNSRSPNYYYSLANKAFDYIQAGKPSLHMRFPEYIKINERYEVFLLVEDLKPETLRKAVLKLTGDENRYKELAVNCEKAAKELNWEREEEKLLEILKY